MKLNQRSLMKTQYQDNIQIKNQLITVNQLQQNNINENPFININQNLSRIQQIQVINQKIFQTDQFTQNKFNKRNAINIQRLNQQQVTSIKLTENVKPVCQIPLCQVPIKRSQIQKTQYIQKQCNEYLYNDEILDEIPQFSDPIVEEEQCALNYHQQNTLFVIKSKLSKQKVQIVTELLNNNILKQIYRKNKCVSAQIIFTSGDIFEIKENILNFGILFNNIVSTLEKFNYLDLKLLSIVELYTCSMYKINVQNYSDENGTQYIGKWGNYDTGSGIILYINKNKYYGNWELCKREGNGTMFYENDFVYSGGWKKDLYEGSGTLTYPNKNILSGHFHNNIIDHGQIQFASGDICKFIDNIQYQILQNKFSTQTSFSSDGLYWNQIEQIKYVQKQNTIYSGEQIKYLNHKPSLLQRLTIKSNNEQIVEIQPYQTKSNIQAPHLIKESYIFQTEQEPRQLIIIQKEKKCQCCVKFDREQSNALTLNDNFIFALIKTNKYYTKNQIKIQKPQITNNQFEPILIQQSDYIEQDQISLQQVSDNQTENKIVDKQMYNQHDDKQQDFKSSNKYQTTNLFQTQIKKKLIKTNMKYFCYDDSSNFQAGKGEIHNTNNNEVYYGSWINSQRKGYGVLKYNKHDLFIGTFSLNKPSEKGTYIFYSREISLQLQITGYFHNLNSINNCQIKYPNGNYVYCDHFSTLNQVCNAQIYFQNGDWVLCQRDINLTDKQIQLLLEQSNFEPVLFNKILKGLYYARNKHNNYEISRNIQYKELNHNIFTGFFIAFSGVELDFNFSGVGQIQYENGEIFRGHFLGGQKINGHMLYVNGDEFIGIFNNDLCWSGKYTRANGTILEGEFKSGFVGYMIFANGDYVQIQCGEFNTGSGIIAEMSKWDRFMEKGLKFKGIGDVFRVK
ncbi:molecular_chaperone Tir [Hexamita inflata]|uniref:Molecular_chaperone Tir n=1 Tax=Hexamita inflata TaxID=28002 RepID=A0ABP1H8K8_9EUKA